MLRFSIAFFPALLAGAYKRPDTLAPTAEQVLKANGLTSLFRKGPARFKC